MARPILRSVAAILFSPLVNSYDLWQAGASGKNIALALIPLYGAARAGNAAQTAAKSCHFDGTHRAKAWLMGFFFGLTTGVAYGIKLDPAKLDTFVIKKPQAPRVPATTVETTPTPPSVSPTPRTVSGAKSASARDTGDKEAIDLGQKTLSRSSSYSQQLSPAEAMAGSLQRDKIISRRPSISSTEDALPELSRTGPTIAPA